jgi:tetratricopeptide (TPR) repeat protein
MKFFKLLFVPVIIFGMLSLSGCSKMDSGDQGKMPITTSSEEAFQDFLKGRDLFEGLQAQESLNYFKQAIDKDSKFAMARLYYAQAQPTPKGFFDEFEKAVALADQVSEGERLWIEGFQAAVNGMPLKQREMYQKLCDLYPNDERAHAQLGNHYFGQQMFKEAIEEYNKTVAINPDYAPVYNQLGYSNRQLGNYSEAEKAFQKYTELIPNDPNPYDSYAELKMKMGDYESSIELYRKALKVNPNFGASHVGIATDYNLMDEHEKGREQLQKYFNMARNDGERRQALFAMAVSYVDQGDDEKALEQVNKMYSIAEETNDAPAMAADLGTMGNILYEMGKYDEAAANYEKAMQTMLESGLEQEVIDNAKRLYLYNVGKVALKKGDLKLSKEKSQEFLAAASEVNNTFQLWLAHELMGMIALAEKNWDKAIEELKQANQQNPYTFYRMAKAYEGKGDHEKAMEFYGKAANDNTLNSMNYAFIRSKAHDMLAKM